VFLFVYNSCQINEGWYLDVDKRCSAKDMRDVFDSHLSGDWSAESERARRRERQKKEAEVSGESM
jgi:hypothetical protein